MTEPLTPFERAALPEHLRHSDLYHFSADCFDNREAQLDAIDDARRWLAANAKREVA